MWVKRLEEELFRQGDKERATKMPVSPLMDRWVMQTIVTVRSGLLCALCKLGGLDGVQFRLHRLASFCQVHLQPHLQLRWLDMML